MTPSPEQIEIIELDGNAVVSAGAGSGKTGVLVEKIKYDLSRNNSHKTIAGITFTIKAAKEIRNRLNMLTDFDGFIGTNNGFVFSEIIQPFMRDCYGQGYKHNYDVSYTIAQESYDACLEYAKTHKVIPKLSDGRQNFIFQLALNILRCSQSAQEYLKAKYFKIFIDEYQDTDTDMHNLFTYLNDELGIEMFIVGDIKQSIYMWRNARPELFASLFAKEGFTHKQLSYNFRCCTAVRNLSNLLREETRNVHEEIETVEDVILYWDCNDLASKQIIDRILKGNPEMQVAILRRTRAMISPLLQYLTNENNDIVFMPDTPLDEIDTQCSWFCYAVAEFCLSGKNIYKFLDSIPSEGIENRFENQPYFNTISNGLRDIENTISNRIVCQEKMQALADIFTLTLDENALNNTHATIVDPNYARAFDFNENRNQIMTLHSSKGKEFDCVVLYANDFNFMDARNSEEVLHLLYVAMTRAKKKLHLIVSDMENGSCINKIKELIHSVGKQGRHFFRRGS